jgi:hypothetical protein
VENSVQSQQIVKKFIGFNKIFIPAQVYQA